MPDVPPGRSPRIIETELTKGENATGKLGLARDFRSVGELVTDADSIARQLLFDVDDHAAGRVLRAWPQLMENVAELIETIPATSAVQQRLREANAEPTRAGASMMSERANEAGVTRSTAYREMREEITATRLRSLSGSVASDLATSEWPGPGPGDQRLEEMSGNLRGAHDLVTRFAPQFDINNAAVASDLAATRARALHISYIATHAVAVHLRIERDTYVREPDTARRRDVSPAVSWLRRVESAEAILASAIRQRPLATAVSHQHEPAPVGLPRLTTAVEAFGTQARRTLGADPIPAEIGLIARTHGMLAGAALTITNAGLETGALETTSTQRMNTAITTSGEAWMDLGYRWRDLFPGERPAQPGLVQAAGELRAACREITHMRDQVAPAETIASRVDIAAATRTLAGAFEAAAGIAEHTRTALSDSQNLTGPARPLDVRARSEIKAARPEQPGPEMLIESTGITTDQKRLNLTVPAPDIVVDGLHRSTDRAGESSAAAAAAGTHVATVGAGDDLARAQEAARLGRAAQASPAEQIAQTPRPGIAEAGEDKRAKPGPAQVTRTARETEI
ncbi:hypothetical protein [Nocardioides albus]|nr:hypothetical protein [Nocardioides albus]GGU46299.1 hypothetical protein GCM10007979_51840 [Nocardioides albus]